MNITIWTQNNWFYFLAIVMIVLTSIYLIVPHILKIKPHSLFKRKLNKIAYISTIISILLMYLANLISSPTISLKIFTCGWILSLLSIWFIAGLLIGDCKSISSNKQKTTRTQTSNKPSNDKKLIRILLFFSTLLVLTIKFIVILFDRSQPHNETHENSFGIHKDYCFPSKDHLFTDDTE